MLKTLVCLIFGYLALETEAWAWGPCVHTMFSVGMISNHLFPVPPEILSLVARFPFEFIYGALSLDFQLKGRAFRHKHTWEDGFWALENAVSDKERAYAIGFLTHLAADIGAHHFFIPRLFEFHPGEKRLRHLMWELRVDRWFARRYAAVAEYTIAQGHHLCDEALRGEEIIARSFYDLKKQVYKNGLFINRFIPHLSPLWQKGKRISTKRAMAQTALMISREAITAVLWSKKGAWPVRMDPMGPKEVLWEG